MQLGKPRLRVVDLGASHVACAVFSTPRRGKLWLDHFVVKTFQVDANVAGAWLEAVTNALREIASDPRYRGNARVSLPGHLVLTKFVRTPAVEPAKREPVVRFEASQNLPYPMDELVWDFAVLEANAGHLEVMVSAARSDAVLALCGAIESVGMRVTAISPANVALYQAFRINYPDMSDRVLIVDVGARSTQLMFVDHTHYFSRRLPFGGDAITEDISTALGVNAAEAEKLKIELHATAESSLLHSHPWRTVQQAVENFGVRLHGEIIRSMANLRGSQLVQPAAIYVTGGGSQIDSLVTALGEKGERPCYLFSPLRQINLATEVVGKGSLRRWPQLSQLVGLAGPLLGEMGLDADLLPQSTREEMEFRRRRPVLIATALLVVVAILPAIFYYRGRASAAEKQRVEVESALQPMQELQSRNRQLVEQIEHLRAMIDALHEVAETKTNWLRFLKDLQERMTAVDDVWLESLAVERDDAVAAAAIREPGHPAGLRLLLSGRLLDRNNPVSKVSAASYDRVKQLISGFSSSEFVASVEHERFDNHQPGMLRFDLTLVVQPQKRL